MLRLDQEKCPYGISLPNRSSAVDLLNGSSAWLEIRLFYVRIAPCVVDIVPDHLTFRLLRRETGCSLKINDAPLPASEVASLVLRRDHLSKDSSEVTYVCTDGVRVSGGVEFEAYEGDKVVLLSGSLERLEAEWSIDCFLSAAAMAPDKSKFVQPKMGVSAPGIEVYIAGCCSGAPVILTRTIMVSPRRNTRLKHGCFLDAIPEDGEIGEDRKTGGDVKLVPHRESQVSD